MIKNSGATLFNILILLPMCLSACSDGGSNSHRNEEITVTSVEQDMREQLQSAGGFSITSTTLVHDDGYQGANIDIGRVIISRFNSNAIGIETLAIALSFKQTSKTPDGTVVAFYIDTDDDPNTGMPISGIGADALFVNSFAFDATNTEPFLYDSYYEWSGSSWSGYNGTFTSGAAYNGASISKTFFASNSSKVPDLIGLTNIKGLMTIQNIPSGDPNSSVTTLNKTKVFSFNIP